MSTKLITLLFFLSNLSSNSFCQNNNFLQNSDFSVPSKFSLKKGIGFIIGPVTQTIILSQGGIAVFQLIDLDGAKNVRIEYKKLFGLGNFETITGFGSITAPGEYIKNTNQVETLFGIGTFLWRVVDNDSPRHVSDTKLLIVILYP